MKNRNSCPCQKLHLQALSFGFTRLEFVSKHISILCKTKIRWEIDKIWSKRDFGFGGSGRPLALSCTIIPSPWLLGGSGASKDQDCGPLKSTCANCSINCRCRFPFLVCCFFYIFIFLNFSVFNSFSRQIR